MKYSLIACFLVSAFIPEILLAQLDAKKVASEYRNCIVKILLVDSAAEKQAAGSGYVGRGSGFIVSEDGIIFTNRHVVEFCVEGYAKYEYVEDGQTYRSTSVYSKELGSDSTVTKIIQTGHTTPVIQVYHGEGENDYTLFIAKVLTMGTGGYDGAMLEIISDMNGKAPTEVFHTAPLGNSDKAQQGEDLCVYGYPMQFTGNFNTMLKDMSTLTFGKMSGYDYVLNKDYGYIKTDASINSGNSGGPVFSENGKVIGIATATANMTNIGLAGGVNGMYYVVEPRRDILERLSTKGLTPPKKSGSISTINGVKKEIKSPEELNKIIDQNNKYLNYYKNSKTTFYYYKNPDVLSPKQSSEFLSSKNGGYVMVDVNNSPNILNTDQLTVEVWKKSGEDYSEFVESKNISVKPNLPSYRFKQVIFKPGNYKIVVYSRGQSLVSSGTLQVRKTKGNRGKRMLSAESIPMKIDYGLFNSFFYFKAGYSFPQGSFGKQPDPFTLAPFSFADPFKNNGGLGAQKGFDIHIGTIIYIHELIPSKRMHAGIDIAHGWSSNKINWGSRGGIWQDSVDYNAFIFMEFKAGPAVSYNFYKECIVDLSFRLCPTLPLSSGNLYYDNGKYNSLYISSVGGFGVTKSAMLNLRYKFLIASAEYCFGKVQSNYSLVSGTGIYVGGNGTSYTYDSQSFKSKLNINTLRIHLGIYFDI